MEVYLVNKRKNAEISLAAQWLRLFTFQHKGSGSIPGGGAKTPQASWQINKQKQKIETALKQIE